MREHGCELNMVDADEVVRIEPALRNARDKIVGGSMTPSDESGDARKFTQNLARLAGAKGVEFLHCTQVLGLDRDAERIKGVRVRNADGGYATLRADSYVVCMGSYSPLLVKPLGIDLLIYPAKGYSVTLPVNDPALASQVSLTDDEYKLVFSRLGERLRIAGTAELNGYSQDLDPVRCEAIVRRTLELFPGVADPEQAAYWSGLRPATPSNVPCIGKTRYRNLYLNTGHGTLGWTHSCGSGRSLADIVSGRQPELDFAFVGLPAARGVTVPGVAAAGWRAPQNAVPRT
jgi:D-amino-acid dehydrogenase